MEASTAHTPLLSLVEALESSPQLDAAGKPVGKAVRDVLGPGKLKDAMSGTWLGHALHPVLTDVVIGSFLSVSLLDLLGGDRDGRAAERLLAVGLAAVGPTALTGLSDWADTEIADAKVRRVGLVHAGLNTTAATLYAASLAARRRGARGRGRLLALAGAGALASGGYLGGHLSFSRGVGPNQTAFDSGPEDWTVAPGAAEMADGESTRVVVDDTPVMLVRHGDEFHALHDRCSHRGCSLSGGEVEGEIVTCPCHGSQFDLRDGSVRRGPATAPQPAYEARKQDGEIQVRLRGGD
jgi:nitrite reductase/ring-hydroxylating ferredoxin subunit